MTGVSETTRVGLDPALAYDADCGFCTTSARWLTARGLADAVPAHELDLSAEDREHAALAAGWLEGGRLTDWGAPAIAKSLIARGGIPGLAGRAMQLPVIRLVADLVYRGVAANRHMMPGSTDACRLPDNAPAPTRWWVRAGAFIAVTVLWLTGIAVQNDAREPYPALLLPSFAGVPESNGVTTSPELELTVVYVDGEREAIDFRALFPESPVQIDSIALAAFRDPARNRSPEVVGWVRARLATLDADEVEPAALEVSWWSVRYESGVAVSRKLTHSEMVRLADE